MNPLDQLDIDVLYDMFKKGASFEELIQKGNTVPEVRNHRGMEAVMNMRKNISSQSLSSAMKISLSLKTASRNLSSAFVKIISSFASGVEPLKLH